MGEIFYSVNFFHPMLMEPMVTFTALFAPVGVEKNNDTSKNNYFSSNRHDAAVEIICSDYRLEQMRQGVWGHPSCVRVKRSYRKRNDY